MQSSPQRSKLRGWRSRAAKPRQRYTKEQVSRLDERTTGSTCLALDIHPSSCHPSSRGLIDPWCSSHWTLVCPFARSRRGQLFLVCISDSPHHESCFMVDYFMTPRLPANARHESNNLPSCHLIRHHSLLTPHKKLPVRTCNATCSRIYPIFLRFIVHSHIVRYCL